MLFIIIYFISKLTLSRPKDVEGECDNETECRSSFLVFKRLLPVNVPSLLKDFECWRLWGNWGLRSTGGVRITRRPSLILCYLIKVLQPRGLKLL